MLRALTLALFLLPAVAHAIPDTTGTTGAATDSMTTGMTDETTTDVPPPEYTPCGCGSERAGGPWALGLTLVVAGWCRRRRAAG
jgi:MYXO-CTERM domain-containing protein